MSATLSASDIQHVAKLANLIVDTGETTMFASQLSAILDFVSKLQHVSTKNTEPTAQVTGFQNIFREDEIDQSRMLTQKQALTNAHASHKGFFQVKAIFE